MSKFIEQIRDELHGVRIPSKWISPLTAMCKMEEIPASIHNEMRRYSIGVKYEFTVDCYPKDLRHMKDNIVAQLRNDIYGEFERRIFELQQAIFERDEQRADSICRDLITEVRGSK